MNIKSLYTLILSLIVSVASFAGTSNEITRFINDNWNFTKDTASLPTLVDWSQPEMVNIPHTWNNLDVTDEKTGYFRGIGWYKKTLSLNFEKGKIYKLNFNGANQVVAVFVNQQKVGTHTGGYSSFSFDISSFLNYNSANIIEVRVDNKHNENIPPLSADFNFFGGIYRDVFIETKNEVCFSSKDYNGGGIYWQTPEVSEQKAVVRLFGALENKSSIKKQLIIKHELVDKKGTVVASVSAKKTLAPKQFADWEFKNIKIDQPNLWSTENPYLYHINSSVIDAKSKELLDKKTTTIGFRWFKFDSEKGFFLNGKHVKLIGTSRHQDYPDLGNALPSEIHRQDVQRLKDFGFNFLRIAHYPQDQEVIETCNKLGIVCTIEIPIVNRITETKEFADNCKLMMHEMIWQNYNHPSLIVWTYMNEIMLRPKFKKDTVRQKIYFEHITELAKELEKIPRALDPYRYTMIPNHANFDLYHNYGITKIPMLVGWNIYKAWYEVGFEGLDEFLEEHRSKIPEMPLLITEYGAGNDARLISDKVQRFDFTNEYALKFHQYYFNKILEEDYIAASVIWNSYDFTSNKKIDAVPFINSKGIFNFDRSPKETAWFYKSQLSKKPFVKMFLPFKNMLSGISEKENSNVSYQRIDVFANTDSVILFHNNKKLDIKAVVDGCARFDVPFVAGYNALKAEACSSNESILDVSGLYFKLIPRNLSSYTENDLEINISCGDSRQFYDAKKGIIWLQDKEYTNGSWGYIGGESYKLETRRGIKPGSDQSILGTNSDPIYQTQRVNPKAYKFDFKAGKYEIKLLFTELSGSSKYDALETKNGKKQSDVKKRTFDVQINGKTVLKDFYPGINGLNTAIDKKFIINTDGAVEIKFIPGKGKPVINAISIRKM